MSSKFIKKYHCIDGSEITTHVANLDNIVICFSENNCMTLAEAVKKLKCVEES